jgi:hypothetical protein
MSDILTGKQVQDVLERLFTDWIDMQLHTYQTLLASHEALRAENADLQRQVEVLTTALQPFSFSEDELFETQGFAESEAIFIRPDDGNDSVNNGWRKCVYFADIRRAAAALAASQPADTLRDEEG